MTTAKSPSKYTSPSWKRRNIISCIICHNLNVFHYRFAQSKFKKQCGEKRLKKMLNVVSRRCNKIEVISIKEIKMSEINYHVRKLRFSNQQNILFCFCFCNFILARVLRSLYVSQQHHPRYVSSTPIWIIFVPHLNHICN